MKTPSERQRRDAWMVREFRAGRTLADVARDAGVTKMRASQIMRAAGVSRYQGGTFRRRRLFGARPNVARGVTLTALADRLATAAAARSGVGVSCVVDYALRLHAAQITEQEFADD
jgi:hypothetical protein